MRVCTALRLVLASISAVIACATVGCGEGARGPQGADGAAGSAGEKGSPGEPASGSTAIAAVTGVSPSVGLLERTTEVTVSVAGVALDASTTFDFGPRIKVSDVVVISPLAARMNVAVAKDAAFGPRGVTVSASGTKLEASRAFQVAAPLEASVAPALVPGGISLVRIRNLDRAALDPTALRVQVNGATLDPGVAFLSATSTDVVLGLFAEPAASGKTGLTLFNIATDGSPVMAFATEPEAIAYGARAPKELTYGTPLTGESLANVLATGFYRIPASSPGIVTLAVRPTGKAITPRTTLYPKSGKAQDLLRATPASEIVLPIGEDLDHLTAVIADEGRGGGATSDYGYDVSLTRVDVTPTVESSQAHGAIATAQKIPALPAIVKGGLGAPGEIDVYEITIAEGQRIELALLRQAKVQVGIAKATAADATVIDFAAADPLVQPTYATLSAVTEAPSGLGAGTYFVFVRASENDQEFQGPPTGKYTVSLRARD